MQNSSTINGEVKPGNNLPTPAIEFKPLAGKIRRGVFSCGELEIDRWLEKAHKHHSNLSTRVVTAHLKGNANPIGFYGLSMKLESDKLIDPNQRWLFRSEEGYFSAVQLCYVGVQKNMQGIGIGRVIMGEAIRVFGEMASRTGICAMTLVAINEQRAEFYERLGFRRYGEDLIRPKMFFPAQMAIDLIEQAAAASISNDVDREIAQ